MNNCLELMANFKISLFLVAFLGLAAISQMMFFVVAFSRKWGVGVLSIYSEHVFSG